MVLAPRMEEEALAKECVECISSSWERQRLPPIDYAEGAALATP